MVGNIAARGGNAGKGLVMKFKGLLLAAALACGAAGSASAAVIVTVDAQSAPWNWQAGGLNDSFQFGAQDNIAPKVVTFASAGITGPSWAIEYTGQGLTSAFGGAPPSVDADGYVGSPFKDNDPGSSGNFFPSHYMPAFWSSNPNLGIFLNALVATFTDASGQIVGNPFPVGYVYDNGGTTVFVKGVSSGPTPTGATQIQLGFNDDIFADNTGSLQVCVGDTTAACNALITPVPEPNTWLLMIAGLGLAGAALRWRRRTATAIA
jgi:hypothetical protein